MASLLYTKFDCNGEWVGCVDYIDRMMGAPHPPRSIKEEERAVQNAIERPVISIYQNACGAWAEMLADCVRNEIASVVDIVRRYTWLNEDAIWRIAYDILRCKTMMEVEK